MTKRRNLDTDTHTQGEHYMKMKAEIGKDAFTSQGMSKIASKPLLPREEA